MKIIYILILFCLFTNCNTDFDLRTETKKNIELIKSNYDQLNALIKISNELYRRNIDKKLSVIICSDNFEISCDQELNKISTNYCVGLNWSCKDIKLENTFVKQKKLDSMDLMAIRTKMQENGIGRTELNNNIIEFLFDQNNFCAILYDLNVKLKPQDDLDLDAPIYIDNIERPCVIDIGNGFSIKYDRLEHGITDKGKYQPAINMVLAKVGL